MRLAYMSRPRLPIVYFRFDSQAIC